MKRFSISLTLVFFLSMFSCLKENGARELPENYKKLNNLFYAYDFTLEDMSRKDRVKLLDSIGYQGVLFPLNGTALKEYTQAIAEVNSNFVIPSVYYHHKMDATDAVQRWKRHVDYLAGTNTDLLLIVSTESGADVPIATMEQFFKDVAGYAAESDVKVAIYPHSGTLIESAAEALPFVKAVNSENFKLSFHLCHELLAGNGERMHEAVAEVAAYIMHASICGADLKRDVNKYNKWGDLIKPLYKGNNDPIIFLKALIENGYTGPIALHTYGLKEPANEHYQKSMDAWKSLSNNIVTSSNATKTNKPNLTIFPNPTTGIATLNFCSELASRIIIDIISSKGSLVKRKEFSEILPGENQLTLNLSHLKNGVYTCVLHLNHTEQLCSKFVINY